MLSSVNWKKFPDTIIVNDLWNSFDDKLSIICKENIPVCKSTPKSYNMPWMDKETLSIVQEKPKLWMKYIHCRNLQNKQNYDQAKRVASAKVSKAQIKYEKSIAEKNQKRPKPSGNMSNQKPRLKKT